MANPTQHPVDAVSSSAQVPAEKEKLWHRTYSPNFTEFKSRLDITDEYIDEAGYSAFYYRGLDMVRITNPKGRAVCRVDVGELKEKRAEASEQRSLGLKVDMNYLSNAAFNELEAVRRKHQNDHGWVRWQLANALSSSEDAHREDHMQVSRGTLPRICKGPGAIDAMP